jgi:hypothetical protein
MDIRNLVHILATYSNHVNHSGVRESTLPETDEGYVGFETLKQENMRTFFQPEKQTKEKQLTTLDPDLNKDPNKRFLNP